MPGEPVEILKWLPFWQVYMDKHIPLKVATFLSLNMHKDCLIGLTELIVNVQKRKLQVSESFYSKYIKPHSHVLNLLAAKSTSRKKKREFIGSAKGRRILTNLLPTLLEILLKEPIRGMSVNEREILMTKFLEELEDEQEN